MDGVTREVLVGNPDLLALHGIPLDGDGGRGLTADATEAQERGQTALLVAIDGAPAGIIAVADQLRPTAREGVAQLQALGLHVVMLTGDAERTARAVAAQAGITEVRANVKPEEKAEVVRSLQAGGHVVAMVGDGINDAPALAAADVGIAVAGGTDVALEAAPVTLMRADIRGVAHAIAISRATMRTMWQNLGWAFAYNVVLIPVAAGLGWFVFQQVLEVHMVPRALQPIFGHEGFLNPVVAAGAMALSSVSVMANSLRLRHSRID